MPANVRLLYFLSAYSTAYFATSNAECVSYRDNDTPNAVCESCARETQNRTRLHATFAAGTPLYALTDSQTRRVQRGASQRPLRLVQVQGVQLLHGQPAIATRRSAASAAAAAATDAVAASVATRLQWPDVPADC